MLYKPSILKLISSRPGRSPASEYTSTDCNPRYGSPIPLLGSEISEAPWQTPRHWRSHCTGTQLTSDRIPMRSCWTSSEPIEYMYMYFTRIPNESNLQYILGYISDTSRYMYLGRFLGVTLDTYQDTSGYVYLGLFITIHLMIHVHQRSGYTEIQNHDTCILDAS